MGEPQRGDLIQENSNKLLIFLLVGSPGCFERGELSQIRFLMSRGMGSGGIRWICSGAFIKLATFGNVFESARWELSEVYYGYMLLISSTALFGHVVELKDC